MFTVEPEGLAILYDHCIITIYYVNLCFILDKANAMPKNFMDMYHFKEILLFLDLLWTCKTEELKTTPVNASDWWNAFDTIINDAFFKFFSAGCVRNVIGNLFPQHFRVSAEPRTCRRSLLWLRVRNLRQPLGAHSAGRVRPPSSPRYSRVLLPQGGCRLPRVALT